MIKFWTLSITIGSVLALGALRVAATQDMDVSKLPPASSQAGVTYDKDIKPVIDKSCVKCHSGEKPKGKLTMTTLAGILKGGKDGIVVTPGNVGQSPLVFAIAHVGDPDDFMPPPKNKANIGPLTKDQVALIRAWVEQGAK